MPLIKPEIQKILRDVERSVASKLQDEDVDKSLIEATLEASGLGLTETVEALSRITNNATSDAIQLRAVETTLKLHNVLKEGVQGTTTVNIIINDTSGKPSETLQGIDPILLPRSLHASIAIDSNTKIEDLIN